MTAANSTKQKQKPAKPYPDFPLYAHNAGQWCRKIRGKIYCFGKWDDPQAAIRKHNREYPYLKAGLPVPDSFDGVTLEDICVKFLLFKKDQLEAGEITERWHDDLKEIAKLISESFDISRPAASIGPDDFAKLRAAICKKHSPQISRNKISRVKSFFKFAYDSEMIDRPPRYGQSFRPPTKANIRRHRATQSRKVWRPSQLREILQDANPQLRAICLLMLNCGLTSSDVCRMPLKAAIDLNEGWLDWPRPKTGIERRAKLWPETIEALQAYLSLRDSDSNVLFVTRWGNPWSSSATTHELAKITSDGSPEWFRKTFQTIAEETESPDFVAIRTVMGHADESMSSHYRQRVADSRLQRVSSHVRKWFLETANPSAGSQLKELCQPERGAK